MRGCLSRRVLGTPSVGREPWPLPSPQKVAMGAVLRCLRVVLALPKLP